MAIAAEARHRAVQHPCLRAGCDKPRLLGDRFCFEHLDPEELEAAVNEPDDEDLEERVHRLERATTAQPSTEDVMARPNSSMRLDPPWSCGCGRFQTDWPAAKGRHQMSCDGTPVATSGRIAAAHPELATRTPPAAKRTRPVSPPQTRPKKRKGTVMPAKKKAKRTKSKRAVSRPGRPARRSPAQPTEERAALVGARDTMLAELRAKRGLIDAAIAGLEALA